MDKIKRGYYEDSSSSSEDDAYIKNEDKIITSDSGIRVFTGTEASTRKQFARFEQKEEKLTNQLKKVSPHVAQQLGCEDSSSHTISQASEEEPVGFL
jgi:hypothetical protein